jgi:UDP:flavonoid glycosyltransferase YjiC (YdhE family)
MSTFLFASIAIEAHTTNPLPIAARLVERGHDVVWYAGARFHERIAAVGATPAPYVEAPDFSGHDIFEYFPQLAGTSGPKAIGTAFDDIFVGHAPARVVDLRRIIAEQRRLGCPVDAMFADELSYGVGFTSELEGIPWATFGDGPLGYFEPDTPPFGPGLMPMRGPIGRLRNRIVGVLARRVIFRKAERTYHRIRRELSLPQAQHGPLDALLSPMLHLQGCTPAFEYPRTALPGHVHWVGALKPDPPRTWSQPEWWGELDGDDRPIIHVTQGSLRPDMHELVVPSVRALADEPVLVVVTTGGPTAADVEAAYGEPLPSNCIVTPWIPYDELLAKASVFVTNGGYTGVTLALSHGVPIVQAGTTEEKAEIAARIHWTGVGLRLGRTGPAPAKIRRAVRRVLDEPSFASAARRVQSEMAAHDAGNEAADLLEQLAVGRQRAVTSSR